MKTARRLAEIGGAVWNTDGAGNFIMLDDDLLRAYATWHAGEETPRTTDRLPRPLQDDGEAWRLMVREGIRCGRTGPTWWRTEWLSDSGVWRGFNEGPDPRRQCVLAALHKHAHDPRWSEIVPSLIERLEQAQ